MPRHFPCLHCSDRGGFQVIESGPGLKLHLGRYFLETLRITAGDAEDPHTPDKAGGSNGSFHFGG
jgi:hypothetical protein